MNTANPKDMYANRNFIISNQCITNRRRCANTRFRINYAKTICNASANDSKSYAISSSCIIIANSTSNCNRSYVKLSVYAIRNYIESTSSRCSRCAIIIFNRLTYILSNNANWKATSIRGARRLIVDWRQSRRRRIGYSRYRRRSTSLIECSRLRNRRWIIVICSLPFRPVRLITIESQLRCR